MMRGERLRVCPAWRHLLAEIGGAPLQVRIKRRHGPIELYNDIARRCLRRPERSPVVKSRGPPARSMGGPRRGR